MSGAPNQVSVVDVLGSFPAEGAVFTTYTLSLSWFEVYLLRQIERQGARRIAVLADPDGVAQSLREGLARGPGLRYALEPVPLPRGVFHAKVAFVWGRQRAVLAVGSGNLTLPGMQRNLEVWDVLLSGFPDVPVHQRLSQEVARGAATFFDHVFNGLDSGAWSRSVLAAASEALRESLVTLPADNGIRWLDSTAASIGGQIVDGLGAAGSERKLQVLAPFHHPRGTAIKKLAEKTDCSGVEILFTSGTAFPMATGRSWGTPTISARRLPFATRPLHAKVFRFTGDGSVLVAGSANATDQALWTTDNVEVCLFRRGQAAEHDALLDGELAEPEQLPPKPMIRDSMPLGVQWARASETGVRMKVTWRGDGPHPERVEVAYVEHADVVLDIPFPSGVVDLPFPAKLDCAQPTPLRVEVLAIGAERWTARAWVSFEGWLEASPKWRRGMATWTRLLNREMTKTTPSCSGCSARNIREPWGYLALARPAAQARRSDGTERSFRSQSHC